MFKRPLKLRNKIQKYDWGSRSAIQSIVGISESGPVAELWMGAHPKAPSEVKIDGRWMSLDKLILEDPVSILGKKVAERFRELPFLFKIIAAERPLSIQVHPDKRQAEEGFKKEEREGIPISAPNRNYKDRNHKPELLCAISRFEALKGFKNPKEILYLLEKAVPKSLKEEISFFKEDPEKRLKDLFVSIMKMDERRKDAVISELVENAEKYKGSEEEYSLVLKLNELFPNDIGIISPLFLKRFILKESEAIYIPPGELHAYIEGVGIELMANSDNVLRGGLTHKHVDIEELLKVVNFRPVSQDIINPVQKGPEKIYVTPAEEFQLSSIDLKKGRWMSEKERSAEIIIAVKGKGYISVEDELIEIKKGESYLIPSSMPQYELKGDALIYKASVPT